MQKRQLWKLALMATSAIALGVTLQACSPKKATEDCGFVQNVYGERISWKGHLPITLALHDTFPDEFAGAVSAAIQTWNKAAGQTIFALQSQKASGDLAARDRVNVISFASTWDQDKLSEQAKTSVHWVGDQIQEADIKVNASQVSSQPIFSFYFEKSEPNAVNIQALVLHELGHVLGLKHKDGVGSVMATYLASNADRVELGETDIDSLKCEY